MILVQNQSDMGGYIRSGMIFNCFLLTES